MTIHEKISGHFKSFSKHEFFSEVSIMVLTRDGQVLSLLGKKMNKNEAQSLGALMVGMWQASQAVADMIHVDGTTDTGLSYQNSQSGFFLLQPTEKNPKVFWSFIFENQINPGKIKNYAKSLRQFFDKIEIFDEADEAIQTSEGFLFENVTAEEVDDLFSFAGI